MRTSSISSLMSNIGALIWCGAFVVSMLGAGIFARAVGLGDFWSMAIMVPPMLLLIPAVRSAQKRGAALGCSSPALVRYNRRALIWSFAYVAALFIAVTVDSKFEPKGLALWLIATLPALPIFYFSYTMRAYLREEEDEYLKLNFIEQSLWGLGFLLILATFWGFLESFGAVPHAPGWLALPIWAIGMGAAGFWKKLNRP